MLRRDELPDEYAWIEPDRFLQGTVWWNQRRHLSVFFVPGWQKNAVPPTIGRRRSLELPIDRISQTQPDEI